MKAKRIILFFLFLSSLIPITYAATPDFGENNTALGQVTDEFKNLNYVNIQVGIVRNVTLNAMELNYTSGGAPTPVYENYTDGDWIEVDAGNWLSQTEDRSTWTNLEQRDTAYLYRDKDHDGNEFDDFTHNFTLEVTTWIDGVPGSRLCVWSMSDYIDDLTGLTGTDKPVIYMYARYVSGQNDKFCIRLGNDDGPTNLADTSVNLNEDQIYYINVTRTGTVLVGTIYSNPDFTGVVDTLQVVCFTDAMRYLYSPQSMDFADGGEDSSGYIEYLWIGEMGGAAGYDASGYFISVDLMSSLGGGSLVDLNNLTIPANTNITLEYSNDGSTWVNNLGIAGFTQGLEGYQAVDLRLLNYTTYYKRENFTTTDPNVTPRSYQSRLITTYAAAGAGPVVGNGLFPGLAIGIAILIIAYAYSETRR